MQKFTIHDLPTYHYGRYGRNECLVGNAMGRFISYQLQPYAAGRGQIVAIQPRDITVVEYLPGKGRAEITYEVFDIEVEVIEGHRFGGFYCGVPISKAKDTAGTIERMTLDVGDFHRCVFGDKPQTYIHAACG